MNTQKMRFYSVRSPKLAHMGQWGGTSTTSRAATLEIRLKLLEYAVRQYLAFSGQLRHKSCVVLLVKRVGQDPFVAVALVTGRAHAGVHVS